MKILKVAVIAGLILSPGLSRAEDLTSRFGLSGILGAAFPVGPEYVTSATDNAGLDLGVLGSFYVSPWLGMGISYENMNLGNGQRVSPIDLLFLFRFKPESEWTPTFQIGGGSARGVNSSRMDNINFKTALGIDWFVAPSVAVGPQVSYYYISHSGEASTYAHLIGVNVLASYYFGSTVK
jgi:hypothetical protein